ncbi:hypothetical protein OHA74_12045 [Streptomyces phaeochromogenes]|uniref:hypothetical protein n=1 Tax=Streptomyces phaeochromogenes TaxID=1923 RepID=UPI002E2E12AA|nr:hypothetical protein [Streptomyces phaeochromogenes]
MTTPTNLIERFDVPLAEVETQLLRRHETRSPQAGPGRFAQGGRSTPGHCCDFQGRPEEHDRAEYMSGYREIVKLLAANNGAKRMSEVFDNFVEMAALSPSGAR